MFYLTLYLCSKFAVTVPYLLPYSYSRNSPQSTTEHPTTDEASDPMKTNDLLSSAPSSVPTRSQAAAPPAYLFILPLIPLCLATYISTTRFSDFRHHGFDIIFGSLIGIVSSSISFRMYHLPIRRGAGWSWGPRSASKAFGIGVGVPGYGGDDDQKEQKRTDVEAQNGASNSRLAYPGPSQR